MWNRIKSKDVIVAIFAGVLLFLGLVVWTNAPRRGQNSEWEQVVVRFDEEEIMEMEIDNWERKTQRICEDGVYFLEYEKEDRQVNLYYKENDEQEKELIERGIESFILNEDETKLFCTKKSIIPYDLGFETDYGIIEIDLKKKTSRMLIDFDDEYIVPKSQSGEKLYYVEISFDKRKSKIFCLDLQTKKEKCIYRSNKEIVGVIIEGNS